MPKYRINPGRSVRLPDGTVAEHPAVIDLEDDVARLNPGVADRLPDDEQPAAEPPPAAG